MEGFYVVFDRQNQRIGFAQTACNHLSHVESSRVKGPFYSSGLLHYLVSSVFCICHSLTTYWSEAIACFVDPKVSPFPWGLRDPNLTVLLDPQVYLPNGVEIHQMVYSLCMNVPAGRPHTLRRNVWEWVELLTLQEQFHLEMLRCCGCCSWCDKLRLFKVVVDTSVGCRGSSLCCHVNMCHLSSHYLQRIYLPKSFYGGLLSWPALHVRWQ